MAQRGAVAREGGGKEVRSRSLDRLGFQTAPKGAPPMSAPLCFLLPCRYLVMDFVQGLDFGLCHFVYFFVKIG